METLIKVYYIQYLESNSFEISFFHYARQRYSQMDNGVQVDFERINKFTSTFQTFFLQEIVWCASGFFEKS